MKAEPILGLVCGKVAVITRVHQWQIGMNAAALAGADSENGEAVEPWSSVNNCTHAAYRDFQKFRESGEVWEGGFNEFYDYWLEDKGYL